MASYFWLIQQIVSKSHLYFCLGYFASLACSPLFAPPPYATVLQTQQRREPHSQTLTTSLADRLIEYCTTTLQPATKLIAVTESLAQMPAHKSDLIRHCRITLVTFFCVRSSNFSFFVQSQTFKCTLITRMSSSLI